MSGKPNRKSQIENRKWGDRQKESGRRGEDQIANRKSKIAIGAAVSGLLVWIAVSPILANLLIVSKPIDHPDAIIVLGGGAAYIERTELAGELFRNGVAPRVILTNDGLHGGWNENQQRNPFFYELAKRNLTANGVPGFAIEVMPDVVESTHDEAILIATSGDRFKRVLIVTSPHHTRRALRTFERAANGIEFGIASPADSLGWIWWLSPTGWKRIGLEYVKLGYYWASGK